MAGNPELIAYYRAHHDERVYGTSSVKQIRYIRPWVRLRRPASILDYGAGQGRLTELLPAAVKHRYDPAIPEIAALPAQPVDLLINVDVLEHIEEHDLDAVLDEMRRAASEAIIIIDTIKAKRILQDGRNAHVTLRPHTWWLERLRRHFPDVEAIPTARSSRAGFKTWKGSLVERARFRLLWLGETVLYLAQRSIGRHKSLWRLPKGA